jgi:ferric-dicitrate binding protein FerR (iron transport regulator)
LEQWAHNQFNEAEKQELIGLLQSASADLEIIPALQSIWEQLEDEGAFNEQQQETMIRNILDRYPANDRPVDRGTVFTRSVHRMHFLRKWGWAAAVLVAVGVGVYFWQITKKDTTKQDWVNTKEQVLPGKNGALLTLADGSQVSLDTISNGVIALQGGTTARLLNGQLVYEGKGSEVMYNTMSTPRGRQFNLTLPDGTNIWLNASSSIRYPTVFTGSERKVEVQGEAYFEVAKNAVMPFRVHVNGRVNIDVLGTHFNVNAYANEEQVNTTLVEGSVKVNGRAITPGQQAQVRSTSDGKTGEVTVVKDADVAKVMAWKNGLFNFENVRLEDAMRQLERWYDIEIVYENGIPNIELMGKLSKGVTLNELMNVLENLGVNAELKGRKLIIFPEKRY